jgi:hypothetical protein
VPGFVEFDPLESELLPALLDALLQVTERDAPKASQSL